MQHGSPAGQLLEKHGPTLWGAATATAQREPQGGTPRPALLTPPHLPPLSPPGAWHAGTWRSLPPSAAETTRAQISCCR